ncbi:hypothetical protein K3495_g12047 [Podosphaera aphanis]|nr:hypothetical protein K3495_g12047 [Podosphaera aphanis]
MSQVQPAAQTNNAKRLNRDQCLQIKTLHDSGMNQTSIAKQLGISRNQVRYTLCTSYIEPKKAAGQPPTLFSSDVVRIEAFITSFSEGRRMLWKRREWAEADKDWTVEDWMAILWTDETWATDGQNKRDWVMGKFKTGEEVNATCAVEKVRKSLGWMFWGSFAGIEEGPCLFWEKERGSITSESYSQRIVPLIDGMVTMRPWVSVTQDNAPHTVQWEQSKSSGRGSLLQSTGLRILPT